MPEPVRNFFTYVSYGDNLADSDASCWGFCSPRHSLQRTRVLPFDGFAVHPRHNSSRLPRFRHGDMILIEKGRIIDRLAKTSGPWYRSASVAFDIHDDSYVRSWLFWIEIVGAIVAELGCNARNVAALTRAVVARSTSTPGLDDRDDDVTIAYHLYAYLRGLENLLKAEIAARVGSTKEEFATRTVVLDQLMATMIMSKGKICSSAGEPLTAVEEVMHAKMTSNLGLYAPNTVVFII